MITRNALTSAIAAALLAAASRSEAVLMNPHGTGQVLIYPYYTVNGQQTLLSVVNSTAHGKALRVRFREAYNGREVAGFNVYLGPYDTWVGAVFDTSSDGTGAAAIATNDNSCTVPAFAATPIVGGPKAIVFSNQNYSQGAYTDPTGNDSGPTNLARTREGFFEIIEMGEVVDQASGSQKSLEAITPVNRQPLGCAQVQAAWASGGYWATYAQTDMTPPAGGLYGAAAIVNVGQGTIYAFDATAIDGFSDVVQHTAPANVKPNLSTAVTDSAHGIATAYVPVGNQIIRADYPVSTQAADAVSAVLMVDSFYNEFNIDPALGAASDWLVTFPTKQFYVDPGLIGSSSPSRFLPPFDELFGGGISGGKLLDTGQACNYAGTVYLDRDYSVEGQVCFLPPTGQDANYLCYEAQPLPISYDYYGPSRALNSRLVGALLGNSFDNPCRYPYHPPGYSNGHVIVSFTEDFGFGGLSEHALRPSSNGDVLLGLPALGFVAENFVNANVTPGVLSNYSAVYPHRVTVTCTNSTNPQNTCQ